MPISQDVLDASLIEKPVEYSEEDKKRVKELNDIMAKAWQELGEIQNKYKTVNVLPAYQEHLESEALLSQEEEDPNYDDEYDRGR